MHRSSSCARRASTASRCGPSTSNHSDCESTLERREDGEAGRCGSACDNVKGLSAEGGKRSWPTARAAGAFDTVRDLAGARGARREGSRRARVGRGAARRSRAIAIARAGTSPGSRSPPSCWPSHALQRGAADAAPPHGRRGHRRRLSASRRSRSAVIRSHCCARGSTSCGIARCARGGRARATARASARPGS